MYERNHGSFYDISSEYRLNIWPKLSYLQVYGIFQPKCPLGGDKIKINQNFRRTLKIMPCYHVLLLLVKNVLTKAILTQVQTLMIGHKISGEKKDDIGEKNHNIYSHQL